MTKVLINNLIVGSMSRESYIYYTANGSILEAVPSSVDFLTS